MALLTDARLRELAHAHLGPARAGDVLSLARTAVRLSPDDETQSAGSRLGGRPHLPADVDWPHRDGRPLSFLCRLQVEDLRRAEPAAGGSGVVLFFYDAQEQPWGFDPADRDGWRTLLVRDPAAATPRDAPRGAITFPEHGVRALPEATLPNSLEPEFVGVFGPPAEAADDVFDLLERVGDARGFPVHQALGWPEVIQNPMRGEVQLVSNGIYVGGPEGYAGPRAHELLASAPPRRLLLQLDSDDDLGWSWGDLGRLYFWIRDDDLAAGRYEDAWCILQCT